MTEIRLSSSELVMNSGEGTQLNVFLTPSNASASAENVVWSSSDGNVASVSNGFIVARNPGQAVITATVDSVSASCVVNVYSRGAINYLLSYIDSFGEINENGNKHVVYAIQDEWEPDVYYVSIIEYWKDENQLVMYTVVDSSYPSATAAVFNYDIQSASSAIYEVVSYLPDYYYFDAAAAFDNFELKSSDRLNFTVIEMEGNVNDSMIDMTANNMVPLTMLMLENHLRNTLGIGVKDLGFVSYYF